jgi:hypothetical protein
MKQLLFVCVSAMTLFVMSCGPKDSRQSFDDPTKYNDFVVDALNELDLTYASTLDVNQGEEKCLALCDTLVEKAEATMLKLNSIQPYEGDSSLTMAAKDFTTYMGEIGKKDLPDFIKKVFNPEMTEADKTQIDQRATDLDKTYEVKMNQIDAVQKALSKKFNFIILK